MLQLFANDRVTLALFLGTSQFRQEVGTGISLSLDMFYLGLLNLDSISSTL